MLGVPNPIALGDDAADSKADTKDPKKFLESRLSFSDFDRYAKTWIENELKNPNGEQLVSADLNANEHKRPNANDHLISGDPNAKENTIQVFQILQTFNFHRVPQLPLPMPPLSDQQSNAFNALQTKQAANPNLILPDLSVGEIQLLVEHYPEFLVDVVKHQQKVVYAAYYTKFLQPPENFYESRAKQTELKLQLFKLCHLLLNNPYFASFLPPDVKNTYKPSLIWRLLWTLHNLIGYALWDVPFFVLSLGFVLLLTPFGLAFKTLLAGFGVLAGFLGILSIPCSQSFSQQCKNFAFKSLKELGRTIFFMVVIGATMPIWAPLYLLYSLISNTWYSLQTGHLICSLPPGIKGPGSLYQNLLYLMYKLPHDHPFSFLTDQELPWDWAPIGMNIAGLASYAVLKPTAMLKPVDSEEMRLLNSADCLELTRNSETPSKTQDLVTADEAGYSAGLVSEESPFAFTCKP